MQGKCDVCFDEIMSHFPKDIEFIKNQVLEKQKQPKTLCYYVQINNQVAHICRVHFKIMNDAIQNY